MKLILKNAKKYNEDKLSNIYIEDGKFAAEFAESGADRVIDLSADNELNDLLFVTNVIITDYSSLVFEASLIDIPMIFYVFDLEKYINERDFYFDFKLYAPGKIVYSTEQLIDSIKNEDYCTEKIKPFADMFFDYRDGRSTQRVVKLIYDNLK